MVQMQTICKEAAGVKQAPRVIYGGITTEVTVSSGGRGEGQQVQRMSWTRKEAPDIDQVGWWDHTPAWCLG